MRLTRSRIAIFLSVCFCAVLMITSVIGFEDSGAAASESAENKHGKFRRILVFSVPGMTWAELGGDSTPNLNEFFTDAAVADMTNRPLSHRTTLGQGYSTLGAGTRAVAGEPTSGAAYEASETIDGISVADVFERRTGTEISDGVAHIEIGDLQRRNRRSEFGAELGALGDALNSAGWSTAVIGNSDGGELPEDPFTPRRQVALALMGSDGTVPQGRVGPDLLMQDAGAPFGVRTNPEVVVDAFKEFWSDDAVVVVEGSDLVRADLYRSKVASNRVAEIAKQGRAWTDQLFGELLEGVDLTRDVVLVVGPATPRGGTSLTIAGIRSPDMDPGLMRSATTRRSGFVQLVDVAPTILEKAGISRPNSMEGRPFESGEGGGTYSERRSYLASANKAAIFRDEMAYKQSRLLISIEILLSGVTAYVLSGERRRRRIRQTLDLVAHAILASFPVTFLAALLPFADLGIAYYSVFLFGGSLALAALCRVLGRRHDLDSMILVLGSVVAVITVDIVTGAHLQFSTVFGYSPTVGGRFAGIGNLAYSIFGASAVLLAGLLVHRLGPKSGRRAAWALLVGVALIDGLPFWGADVGGALSMVPAFGITLMMFWGRRIHIKAALLAAAATVISLGLFAAIDVARPVSDRTHLGRLVESTRDEGWMGFWTTVHRKLEINLAVLDSSVWRIVVPVVIAFVIFLARRAPSSLREIQVKVPPLGIAMRGLTVLCILGFALNDSGIAIPGVMLGILNSVLVSRVLQAP